MFINMSDYFLVKSIVRSWIFPLIQNTKIEVQQQDKDYISSLVQDPDSSFFTYVLFATSISPCET
jgi:hypothetical protein